MGPAVVADAKDEEPRGGVARVRLRKSQGDLISGAKIQVCAGRKRLRRDFCQVRPILHSARAPPEIG